MNVLILCIWKSENPLLIPARPPSEVLREQGYLEVRRLPLLIPARPPSEVLRERSNVSEVKAGRLKVYPNPVRDVLHIEISEGTDYLSLELYTVTGQKLLHTQLNLSSQEIQMSHLPPGVYLLKLTNKNGTSSMQRIVIAR